MHHSVRQTAEALGKTKCALLCVRLRQGRCCWTTNIYQARWWTTSYTLFVNRAVVNAQWHITLRTQWLSQNVIAIDAVEAVKFWCCFPVTQRSAINNSKCQCDPEGNIPVNNGWLLHESCWVTVAATLILTSPFLVCNWELITAVDSEAFYYDTMYASNLSNALVTLISI